ncbi:MAG: DUF4276 family protein, partial [Armatimonadetes bacterium]|nr:DUF4276 family protein [Armatimonadota bacterium]
VEGAGADDLSKSSFRRGFGAFFASLVDLVRQSGGQFKWHGVIPCGGRLEAYKDFCTALKQSPDDWNILLVDAEEALPEKCANPVCRNWEHLAKRQGDGWGRPDGVDDSWCFLMITTMETWLIADRVAITTFYGNGFNPNALPKNADLQSVSKDAVMSGLERAIKDTTKGKKDGYKKIAHGCALLQAVNVATVRAALPECDRLFRELEARIAA